MLNGIQKQDLQGIAALGRNEDTILAHVAPDEMVIPAEVLRNDPFLNTYIYNSISKYGVDPNQFIVGSGDMDLNPLTGLPEFGFLSKVFKKIKKVAKKVAPVAAFIPGVGTAIGAIGGSLGGAIASKVPFLGKVGSALSTGAKGLGSLVSKVPGLGSVGQNIYDIGNVGAGVAKGRLGLGDAFKIGKQAITSGIGGLFGPSQPYNPTTREGQSKIGRIEDTFKLLTGDTGQSRTDELIAAGYTEEEIEAAKQAGTFNQLVNEARASGKSGQGRGLIGGARNIFGGGDQQQGGGGFLQSLGGAMTSPAGLAGLYGLATYLGAKEREGGLSETPAVTMDSLGRYQLSKALGTGGTREEFGLGPAPKALKFAEGDVVEMEDYINELTNQLVDAYKKDKKYKESSFLPSSYIMSEEEQAKQERKRKNMTLREAMDEYRPSYNLLLMARKILTGETGDRIPQAKIDEIKDMVRSSIKEKQMAQLGFNAGGSVMMEELDMRQGGESIGPGTGTSDDIPAMLSDGEFVMTAKATRGAGAYETKKTPKGIELIHSGDPSRDAGVENMRELMKMFEAV